MGCFDHTISKGYSVALLNIIQSLTWLRISLGLTIAYTTNPHLKARPCAIGKGGREITLGDTRRAACRMFRRIGEDMDADALRIQRCCRCRRRCRYRSGRDRARRDRRVWIAGTDRVDQVARGLSVDACHNVAACAVRLGTPSNGACDGGSGKKGLVRFIEAAERGHILNETAAGERSDGPLGIGCWCHGRLAGPVGRSGGYDGCSCNINGCIRYL